MSNRLSTDSPRGLVSRFSAPSLALLALLTLGLMASGPAMAGDAFADAIEATHGKAALMQQQALQADITVQFGGNTMVEGTLTSDIYGGKVRIDLDNGTSFIFDGQEAWTSPAKSEAQGGRFHVLTWSYFLLAPFKLQDEGSQLEDLGKRPYREGKSLPAARLTFDAGTGDSPDDWYVVYRNQDHQLESMAYIVTFGKDLSAAEKEPHAVTYHAPVTVDGVTFSSQWSFWNWSEDKGIEGDAIGRVELSGIQFVTPAADTFKAPKDSRPEPVPGS